MAESQFLEAPLVRQADSELKKEQFNPDLESFRRPWLGTQGPVSGQSRISETGTTTAY